jgi:homoserine kinase
VAAAPARVTVRVPATTANIGPGYDSFGLALGLFNTFTAEPAEVWSVDVLGEGAGELSSGADNVVASSMARGLAECGVPAGAARITCENGIPTGRGLGSSSSALVGGLLLADAWCEGALGREGVFSIAAELEGHADNVAAAVFGGLTACWNDGGHRCAPLTPAPLAVVVVVAAEPLSTKTARAMLPDTVPFADAAFDAGRAGLTMAGLLLGRGDLLGAGLVDKLHEPYRATVIPDFDAVRAALLEAGADGAALSGAGPTVMGIVTADDNAAAFERAARVAEAARRILSLSGRRPPLALAIDRTGAVVL